MNFARTLFTTLLFCACTFSLGAVSVKTNGIPNQALYGIDFGDGVRFYHGKEATAHSISLQEYVTSAFRVVEINIVTEGSGLLRIYHSRSLKAGELAKALSDTGTAAGIPSSSIVQRPLPPQIQDMANRASGVADSITGDTVIKEYPIATHAHTIEFRINSRNELLDLHDQLKKHWLKEPAYFENGQIVTEGEETATTQSEMKPRSLGGTLFTVSS